jgi:hypothetical protein
LNIAVVLTFYKNKPVPHHTHVYKLNNSIIIRNIQHGSQIYTYIVEQISKIHAGTCIVDAITKDACQVIASEDEQ